MCLTCVSYIIYAYIEYYRNAVANDGIDESQKQNFNTFQESLLDFTSIKDN